MVLEKITDTKKIEKINVECHRCKHKWIFTGSKLKHLDKYPVYAQCPVCRTSVKIKKKDEVTIKVKEKVIIKPKSVYIKVEDVKK